MPWDSPDRQLLRAIVKRDCCLFLGSGFSAAVAGYSSATALHQELLRAIPKYSGINRRQLSRLSLDVLSEFYENLLGRPRLLELLWSLFNHNSCDIIESREATLRLLTDFKWRTIYTTNYDPLIESTLRRNGITARVITRNSDLRKLTSHETPIIKLHGCINEIVSDDITPIIITESDYFDQRHRRNREILYSRLSSDLSHNTFLFVGYGMKEESFRRLWTSTFFAITQARGSSQIYNLSDNSPHYAVTLNATTLDKRFWSSYGVHLLEERLEEFTERICDYKEKAFSSLQGEYFPDGEYFFLTSSGPAVEPQSNRWNPPLHRYQYDEAVWDLSRTAFTKREDPNSLWAKLRERSHPNLQIGSLLLMDAKLPPETKQFLAKQLADDFCSIDSSCPGETQEQAVSALPHIWHLLNRDSQEAVAEVLTRALESDDFLATYKATLNVLEITHEILEDRVLSFIQAHLRDGTSDTFAPALTKPIARLFRQVGYSLLPSPNTTWDRNSSKLLSFLEHVTNPLLTWEIGAVAATKCRWDKNFENKLLRQINRAADKCTPEHFVRYVHVLKLRPNLIDALAIDSARLYKHCISLLSKQGGESTDILMARTGLTIQLLSNKKIDAFISLSIPHLRKSSSNPTWRAVALSIPTAARRLPKKNCITVCAKLIDDLLDNPLLAQPLFYILLDTIFRSGQYEETKHLLLTILDQLRQSQSFQKDDWARFTYVGLIAIYLQKTPLNNYEPILEVMRKYLIETLSDPSERLTLRGLALQGIAKSNARYHTDQLPNFRSISS